MGKETTKIDDLTIESAAEGPTHERVKILQYTTMVKLYSETIQDYNESLLRYHEKCTSLLNQQRLLSKSAENISKIQILLIYVFFFLFYSQKANHKCRVRRNDRCSRN